MAAIDKTASAIGTAGAYAVWGISWGVKLLTSTIEMSVKFHRVFFQVNLCVNHVSTKNKDFWKNENRFLMNFIGEDNI